MTSDGRSQPAVSPPADLRSWSGAGAKPILSIEIYPPKTEQGCLALEARLSRFAAYRPNFVSVTYGAGGTHRDGSLRFARFLTEKLSVRCVSHLTCVGQSREELSRILDAFAAAGIQSVLALRGDPPAGEAAFKAREDGFAHASDLIALAASKRRFLVGCAAYAEGHVEAPSIEADVQRLEEKIRAGARFLVSQFFLDNVYFLRFRDRLRARGIREPLLAGILPISNYSQIAKFSITCGCTIPAKVMRGLHGRSDEDQEKFGLDHAAHQVEELVREGVDGIHLYALNKQGSVERLAPIAR